LAPYFALVQAVRLGDLAAFQAASETHGATFDADKLMNLITRLRANVIRTGLTRINTAYSKISLADVAEKLGLPSVEDAESVVAKAIRDGNVDAVIDHSASVMYSKETTDVYSTQEPQNAFHVRIAFCLDTHNEAVKAMRYPPKNKKSDTKDAARGSRIDNDSGIDDLDDLLDGMEDDGDFF
jgi:26S proteasome regulatory subunit N3